jgi:hypothetical protein
MRNVGLGRMDLAPFLEEMAFDALPADDQNVGDLGQQLDELRHMIFRTGEV